MGRLLRYLKPYRVELLPVVFGCAVEMAFNAQLPLSIKFLIDHAIARHDGRVLILVLIALIVGAALTGAAGLMRDYYYARIISQIVAGLRGSMFEKLQRLSLDFFSRIGGGDIVSRFSNDLATAEAGFGSAVAWAVQPALDIAICFVLILVLDWRLALAALVLSPVVVLGPRLFSNRTERASDHKQQLESHIVTAVQETIAAAAVIRAYGMQQAADQRFSVENAGLRDAMMRLGFVRALMERSTDFATLLLEVAGLFIAGLMAFQGFISVGTFVAFQALFRTLSYSVKWIAQFSPTLAAASGGLKRVESLLDESPQVADAPSPVPAPAFSRGIELRDVNFTYTQQSRDLDNVTLTIPKGNFTAIVGPSGSGKSTVLNLILRFYDPSSGAVLLDGLDLRRAEQSSLRRQMGVVFQENILFHTTVRENIRIGNPGASDQQVEAAARAAEIHDFVTSLPSGYDTLCGERGSRFSGGQRQRIAIARALLRNPSILLLDEATSALDPASEAAINTTFERLAQGRTVITVTHRLSAITGADRIFVLDRGRLVEAGTHRQLLTNNGVYARMWHRQQGVHMDFATARATVDEELLAAIPIFSAAHRSTLIDLAGHFVTERFDHGRAIVTQGETADRMYVIARGTVEVWSESAQGERRRLAKLTDGDYFGEMALLNEEPRNATVEAVGPCVCLSLHAAYFRSLLAREPGLRQEIERVAALRATQ